MWFIDFIVAKLLVQPTHDILACQPISHPKGVVSLRMVLRVRLLEVGGSTWGALGKAFFPFTFGGALGKAFFPFTFFYGTGAVGGGTKRIVSP